jgi:imidazole glycerol-phosphate synthase subunit HisH
MIGVVDLNMGNLRSVVNAISQCGFDPSVVSDPAGLEGVSHVVLPGVGSYAIAMANMSLRSLLGPLRAFAATGRPLLGICLGMQLLSTLGEEGGQTEGLSLIRGSVVRFDPRLVPAIPHVGWNVARRLRPHPLFRQVRENVDFYYVHSYHFVCDTDADRLAVTDYGEREYTSIVARANVVGVQFHPEKSQASGLRVLENFCAWDGKC